MDSALRLEFLLNQASDNDWISLQDMSENAVGNDNSDLVLSLDEATGENDDVYVVHYDMKDVGKLATYLQSLEGLPLTPYDRCQASEGRGPEAHRGLHSRWTAIRGQDRGRMLAADHLEGSEEAARKCGASIEVGRTRQAWRQLF